MNDAMKLQWRKTNLANRKENRGRDLELAKRFIENINRQSAEIEFLEYQIECAEKEGKEKFDIERYKQKDKKDKMMVAKKVRISSEYRDLP